MIAGRADPVGTRAYAERAVEAHRLPAEHFREGPAGLRLSSLGLGTYLGAPDGPTDRAVEEAVALSLRSGRLNVIDTAINYRHQRAERSVGRAIARSISAGHVAREEVFVATKVGYLAPDGESGLPPERWISSSLIEPGILDAVDIVDGVHAMSPSYLSDQIDRSRHNLGLETLDLLYLHNAADAQRPALGPEEFGRRLRSAFERLEEERERGAISAYGLATWEALRAPLDDPVHVALEDLVRLAEELGGADHGFRYVQLPFNRLMPEAAERRNQPVEGQRTTLFEAAGRLGVACMTNVPLLQGRLATGRAEAGRSPAQVALQFARSAPGNTVALVGSKQPAHLSEDLAVASFPIDP